MEERTGEAFAFDERLTVVGSKLLPGEAAPDFLLENPVCDRVALRWEKQRPE